jgi:hypothetical protein
MRQRCRCGARYNTSGGEGSMAEREVVQGARRRGEHGGEGSITERAAWRRLHNSRSLAFEGIMGTLCQRIDELNDQMSFVMKFVQSGRLERLEKSMKNQDMEIVCFAGTRSWVVCAKIPR